VAIPYVDISRARFEEQGSVHMESPGEAGARLTAHLENGQVRGHGNRGRGMSCGQHEAPAARDRLRAL
jgi:hypothetical protein